MDNSPIHISTPSKEGTIQVSKWLKFAALLTVEEMQNLLDSLGDIAFYDAASLVSIDEMVFSKKQFLAAYAEELKAMATDSVLPASVKKLFSLSMSLSSKTFYAHELKAGKYLLRPILPAIQIRSHQFVFAPEDKKFFSQVFSSEAIRWGIEFSYPQIFQNSLLLEHEETLKNAKFINSPLIKIIQKWMRDNTSPTPFYFAGQKINAPFRIGKKMALEKNFHPTLQKVHLSL